MMKQRKKATKIEFKRLFYSSSNKKLSFRVVYTKHTVQAREEQKRKVLKDCAINFSTIINFNFALRESERRAKILNHSTVFWVAV
jgi:hypothetical protein